MYHLARCITLEKLQFQSPPPKAGYATSSLSSLPQRREAVVAPWSCTKHESIVARVLSHSVQGKMLAPQSIFICDPKQKSVLLLLRHSPPLMHTTSGWHNRFCDRLSVRFVLCRYAITQSSSRTCWTDSLTASVALLAALAIFSFTDAAAALASLATLPTLDVADA